MINITTQGGELRMTIEITRAATGLTETHEIIGKIIHGNDTFNSGAECGDGRGDGTDRDEREPEVQD